jgi:hypothetical protein
MKSIVKIALVLSGSLLLINPSFAQVSKISSENLVQIGKDAFWSADVNCEGGSVRTIQRKTDGNEWCGKVVSGFCATSKDAAAKKICDSEYTAALTLKESTVKAQEDAEKAQEDAARAQQRAESAERERAQQRRLADQRLKQQQEERAKQAASAAASVKKQTSIEEKLILIEQEKLNLRRQELELQKRAVEIEKLLEKTS